MPRLPGFGPDCTITFDGEAVPARTGELTYIYYLKAQKISCKINITS